MGLCGVGPPFAPCIHPCVHTVVCSAKHFPRCSRFVLPKCLCSFPIVNSNWNPGPIPQELLQLPALRNLNLENNKLKGKCIKKRVNWIHS